MAIVLNTKSLLGFRIAGAVPGGKVGHKPKSPSAKIGSKPGIKS